MDECHTDLSMERREYCDLTLPSQETAEALGCLLFDF